MVKPFDIVLTGPAGFIGNRLVQRACELGYKITALDLPANEKLFRGIKNVRFIGCDITDRHSLKKINGIGKNTVLVHLAAFVPHIPSREDKARDMIIDVNLRGTSVLLDSLKGRLKKVVYISTLEVYGKPVYLPIDEKHPANPVTYYGLSKLMAESYARVFCLKNAIEYVSLRLSCVYGPGENYDRAIPNFIKAALKNSGIKIYGNGQDLRDYIFIDDAVNAILLAARSSGTKGQINIASGRSYKISETARLIKEISRSGSRIKSFPAKKGFYDIVFNTACAKKELGFQAKVGFRQGLAKEIDWFSASSV